MRLSIIWTLSKMMLVLSIYISMVEKFKMMEVDYFLSLMINIALVLVQIGKLKVSLG